MDIGRKYGTSSALENEGRWFELGENAAIKVARDGNRAHKEALKRLWRPHRAALRAGSLPDEQIERMAVEAMAEALLLDWRGIEEEGVVVPYSREAALRLLTRYPDFRNSVAALSADMANYQAEEEEAARGN